ncbi:class 1 fructose-bisphosphatase [Sinimarinibacterium flocculans]|uniref:Fructose-1,6-bisphosphatase class 1 n=1 Tax=Sinimarinibacterium flocculans TaxID=985250 RepID=A0A318E3A6_9GAMM|nr:class 1 fructose-bisphosphatase [Sinimarinibacterium flocculans]PXV65638.1 D-fructose 1,6-bisphosphatase [Sinimarinibacterium flocculans]
MHPPATLRQHLQTLDPLQQSMHAAIADTVLALADGARELAELISLGTLAGTLGALRGGSNADGDAQKELDLRAHELFVERLRGAPVAAVASEEAEAPQRLDAKAPLAVAIDPLDGSSNIDTNVSIGTIFSILPAIGNAATDFLQPGHAQLAAGFFIYGPQTALVLTLGRGTQVFILDRRDGDFRLARAQCKLPAGTREYAINASNYRHWEAPIRAFVEDCERGSEGPRGSDFNMRWIASLVADGYRILTRGGVFLYPGDRRRGYRHGRLRLVYEANPVAMVMEQAGGAATDGVQRILDIQPATLHQRTPLVFGAIDKVERVRRYHVESIADSAHWPLFGRRGLLRG